MSTYQSVVRRWNGPRPLTAEIQGKRVIDHVIVALFFLTGAVIGSLLGVFGFVGTGKRAGIGMAVLGVILLVIAVVLYVSALNKS